MFRTARMLAIGATVLAAALGLTFGLLLPSVARADDPPPTTVPTTTVPAPDPAPPPKPKPKPVPKPAPKPAPPRTVSQTPAYQPPRAPAPSTRPAAAVKPKVRPHPKPKKKAPVKKKTIVLPKVTVAPPVSAGVQNAFGPKSGGGSLNLGSMLIVLGLSFAIACFAVAVVPATYVKWRPAAIFVSERQVDLTLVGLVLLVAAAFTLFWTNGP